MTAAAQHPFQCLAVAKPTGADHPYLLAACGARLVSTSLGKDATIFEWSAARATAEPSGKGLDEDERPAKKQKTTAPTAPAALNIIKLAISPSNQHAVVVTEDKAIRVLEISGNGSLAELSQRAMPKRPCAVTVLPDNATILCGDKFGDVYSLPLLPAETAEAADAIPGAGAEQPEKIAQAFKPSASNTTVHTKRNRKALEAQLKQKNLTAKTKEPLKFEHTLLLGHVSMLVDLAFATREVEGKQRNYILTADRDEHIRVSRGLPQSHIIEGYCLGHKEYVSNICPIAGTDLLLSGGGDNWIGVWDWLSFKLKRKLDILDVLKVCQSPLKIENVNVSGIWVVELQPRKAEPVTEPCVVVACEGVPAMLVCPTADLLTDGAVFQPLMFGAPVLDITSFEDVSIATFDDRTENGSHRLMSFRLQWDEQSRKGDVQLFQDDIFVAPLKQLNGRTTAIKDEKVLDSLLYGVAILRKRGYQNGEEGGDAEDGPAAEAEAGDAE